MSQGGGGEAEKCHVLFEREEGDNFWIWFGRWQDEEEEEKSQFLLSSSKDVKRCEEGS